MNISALETANYNYHNGLPLTMTDAEYDAAIDQLRAADPQHPFLTKIGAPTVAGDEVVLPVPLPSLNKIKANDGSLDKWMGTACATAATHFHASVKLDGCSALWIPSRRQLFTRGDGVKGRDISVFAPLFKGCVTHIEKTGQDLWVRGELIMRTDAPAVPAGKLARNIVAGALNRKAHEVDPVLFGQIEFVAYELISATPVKPSDGYAILRKAGFNVAKSARIPRNMMVNESLSSIFDAAEKISVYQLDGIVLTPDVPVPPASDPTRNPVHKVAWKTRSVAQIAETNVSAVEWNISAAGVLIPRVLLDPPVSLSGATIKATTGIHAAWIRDNRIGPGARVSVRRAGDVIPQIAAVLLPAPAGPAMPTAAYVWDSVHIRPADTTDAAHATESLCIQLAHGLKELGAENVGAGIVARLVAAGFTTLRAIYAATAEAFAAKVEGVKDAGAKRIWEGLRAQGPPWAEVKLMMASCVFPRGIGAGRLEPLLALEPNPALWDAATFKAAKPAGLSPATIDSIVATVPAYLVWRNSNFPGLQIVSAVTTVAGTGAGTGPGATSAPIMTVVLTGFRDKALEAALEAKGHIVGDTVTKKTTHLVHPDGPTPTTGKGQRATELGIPTMGVTAFRAALGL
uniref:NAD-dependent DNA ligase N-terminal domain-containing protein n=1 Tax=viral metagenome TaxID=1070528 RepID=A0A6C0DA43_9ZZZZ